MSMMASKGFLAAAAALAVSAMVAGGCAGDPLPSGERLFQEVSFAVDTRPSTRSGVSSSEGAVRSLDVLVYRADDGLFDSRARVEATGDEDVSEVSAVVTLGPSLRWWVVANAPDGILGSYASEEAFLAGHTFLTDGTDRSLVMYGCGTLAGAQEGPVAVSLDRYTCKVTLESVVFDWGDAYAIGDVRLGRFALVNVVGSTLWSGEPEAGFVWHNRMGIDPGEPEYVRGLTVKDWGGRELEEGVPADTRYPLYCLPNPLSGGDSSADTQWWSPRGTRLSVEVLIGGVSNWYPVDLPAMACNTHYIVRTLTIRGPGSDGPDKPVRREEIDYSVTVVPWEDDYVPVVF